MSNLFHSTGLPGLTASVIFGVFVAGFSTGSSADPGSVSINVKYADLNVASPSGALVLYRRIQSAAKTACNFFWFKTDADEAGCVQHTIANAVRKVNQPMLSAVYNSKHEMSQPSSLLSQSHSRPRSGS